MSLVIIFLIDIQFFLNLLKNLFFISVYVFFLSLIKFFFYAMPYTNLFLDKYFQGNFSPGSFFLSGAISECPKYIFINLYFLINNDNFILSIFVFW